MTEETVVDDGGAGGSTKPPVSQTPVTGDEERLAKIVKSVLAEELKPIKGDIGGLYSRQDKQQNAFGDFLKEFNKAKAGGLSDQDAQVQAENTLQGREQQAKREKAIDLVLERFGNDSSTSAAGTGTSGADEASKVFAKYEVDLNDPAAVGFLSLKGADLVDAVASYKVNKLKQPTLDSSAAGSLQGGSQNNRPPSLEKMTEEYKTKMIAARGNKNLLSSIREDYKKKGVDVYNVSFS